MTLRGRVWELTVDTTRVRSDDVATGQRPLTVRFDITKTLGREPNKASIQVANLSPRRREALEQSENAQVQLVAGYRTEGQSDTIFVGDARDIFSLREETDIWTTIESEDGGRSYRTATITATLEAGVTLARVITVCAEALGVGLGNTSIIAADATLDSGSAIFEDGIALEGPAWRALDTVCRSASLRWSVQNGVLQLRPARRPAETRAIRLSPTTGLIGSPTRSSKDERTGRVSVDAQALLIPGLYPGRVVVLESTAIEGNWIVDSVRYTGDSTGNDWFANVTLKDFE